MSNREICDVQNEVHTFYNGNKGGAGGAVRPEHVQPWHGRHGEPGGHQLPPTGPNGETAR